MEKHRWRYYGKAKNFWNTAVRYLTLSGYAVCLDQDPFIEMWMNEIPVEFDALVVNPDQVAANITSEINLDCNLTRLDNLN